MLTVRDITCTNIYIYTYIYKLYNLISLQAFLLSTQIYKSEKTCPEMAAFGNLSEPVVEMGQQQHPPNIHFFTA